MDMGQGLFVAIGQMVTALNGTSVSYTHLTLPTILWSLASFGFALPGA